MAAKEPVSRGDQLDALVAPVTGLGVEGEELEELDVARGLAVVEDDAADARLDEAKIFGVLGTARGESSPELRIHMYFIFLWNCVLYVCCICTMTKKRLLRYYSINRLYKVANCSTGT